MSIEKREHKPHKHTHSHTQNTYRQWKNKCKSLKRSFIQATKTINHLILVEYALNKTHKYVCTFCKREHVPNNLYLYKQNKDRRGKKKTVSISFIETIQAKMN